VYRVAEVEALEERLGDHDRALAARERVIELLRRLSQRVLGPERGVDVAQLRALELGQLASGVAQSVGLPTREKQALLEADTLAERLESLAGALDFHLALLERTPAEGPETVH
jgi:Lon protease-like protein